MKNRKGLQTGPDLIPIVVPVLVAVLAFSGAFAGISDGPDVTPTAKAPEKIIRVHRLTEDPSPIDLLKPVEFAQWPTMNGQPLFINPELPTAIGPVKGLEEIVLDDPAENGSCSDRQITACTAACKTVKKMYFACDVKFDWQPDGSCQRTLLCTCQDPGAPSPRITSLRGEAWEIEIEDDCALDPACATE